MKISDQAAWQSWIDNNTDPYGKGVIDYAERWADLMEARLTQGQTITTMAASTSHEADTEGITGFMYGAAVSVLATSWEHGEELRRWHNLDVQIRDEGERANESGSVLNPALLNVGEPGSAT
jgi:hypothetical protein